jgi:histone acetyltransferase
MECRLDPRAASTYANLPEVLSEQRAAVDAAVRGRSQSHVVWPGLERFEEENRASKAAAVAAKEGGAGAALAATPPSAADLPALFEFAPLADAAASIPGVAEAGWPAARAALAAASPPPSLLVGRTWRPASDPGALRAFAHSLLCELAAHEDAWPFLEPVDPRDVPDYGLVVKDPMDFSTLKRRLAADHELAEADEEERRRRKGEGGQGGEAGGALPSKLAPPRGRFYSTLDVFVADARRIFSNARAYNAADTIYSKLATRLEGELDAMLAARISWGGVGGVRGGGGGGGG